MVTLRQKDAYLSGQWLTFAHDRIWLSYAARRGVIWCPGAGGDDREFVAADASELAIGTRDTTRGLTDLGYPIVSLNTSFTWGNDTAMTRMDALYGYAMAEFDFPEEVILIGGSQGGTTMTNWAKRNPEKVAAMVGLVPLTHLDAFHDGNVGGFASSIETAYGGLSAYNAAVPTHDPIEFADELVGIPMRSWYSTDDPLIDPDWVQEFMDAQGGQAVPFDDSGHSIDGLDLNEVYEYLMAFDGVTQLAGTFLSDDTYLSDDLYLV